MRVDTNFTTTPNTTAMAARIVLPGDVVGLPEAMTQARVVRIGPGLRQEEAAEAGGSGSGSRSNGAAAMEEGEASAAVVAAKAGVVQQARNSIWIETSQRRVRAGRRLGG